MSDFEIHRLDEDGVIEMARGIVMGDRYYYTADALQTGAPMFLFFLGLDHEDAEKIGMVVGDTNSAVRSINGHPAAMSGWLVHIDDTEAVMAKTREYLTALGYKDPAETGEEE